MLVVAEELATNTDGADKFTAGTPGAGVEAVAETPELSSGVGFELIAQTRKLY